MSQATLLFFSRDPGPTNVLMAVYEFLIKVVWPNPYLLTLFGITL